MAYMQTHRSSSLTAARPLVHIPALVVSDQPLFRAFTPAIGRGHRLAGAKVLGGAAEAKLGAADVERALVVRGPPRTPAWIAFTLATAVGDAAVAAELWTQTANTNTICRIASSWSCTISIRITVVGPRCCRARMEAGRWLLTWSRSNPCHTFSSLSRCSQG